MAQITIGGKEYLIPEMNFLAIERAWPFVMKATETVELMTGVSAALSVIAAGLMEAEDFNPADFDATPGDRDAVVLDRVVYFFKKNLKGNEIGIVRDTMFQILKEAGLEVTEGEALAALAAAAGLKLPETLSPETAPDTSLNSLPLDAREEAGTE